MLQMCSVCMVHSAHYQVYHSHGVERKKGFCLKKIKINYIVGISEKNLRLIDMFYIVTKI